MKVILGTQNPHKVAEISRLLHALAPWVQLETTSGPSPDEDGESFGENALVKARAAFNYSGTTSIADDSGIEVSALDGRPGIFSARYSDTGDDLSNNLKLLSEMDGVLDRRAAFVCAAAVVWAESELVIERRWVGRIAPDLRGTGGFGYDSLFIPNEFSVTSAQLSPEQKERFSHRGQAFRAVAETLSNLR